MTALNAHPAGRYHMDPCSVLATACTLAYQHQPDAAALQLDKLDGEQREAALLAVDAVRARLLTILDSSRQVTGMSDTFTCDQCGETFAKTWTDEEAAAEAAAVFEPGELVGAAVVCDPCWQAMRQGTAGFNERYTAFFGGAP